MRKVKVHHTCFNVAPSIAGGTITPLLSQSAGRNYTPVLWILKGRKARLATTIVAPKCTKDTPLLRIPEQIETVAARVRWLPLAVVVAAMVGTQAIDLEVEMRNLSRSRARDVQVERFLEDAAHHRQILHLHTHSTETDQTPALQEYNCLF